MKEAELLATMKRIRPDKLVAVVGDERREVAVPNVRKRWERVLSTLSGLTWSTLELQDKKGALLHTCENTSEAGSLEVLSGGRTHELHALLGVVLRAQSEAMKYRDSEVQALLRAQGDVLREVTGAVRSLTALHQEQLQVAREMGEMEAQQAEAAAVAEQGDQMKQLLEALPVLLQALPAIKQLLGAAPNGVS